MHTKDPTAAETIAFLKRPQVAVDQALAEQHLENLLYMKSVLYVDDKNNEKHLQRIRAVLDALKKEFSKELSEPASAEGISVVAQILAANKLIDSGITYMNGIIKRGGLVHQDQASQSQASPALDLKQEMKAPLREDKENTPETKENPKLRETLSFLISMIGDPLRNAPKKTQHFLNLEKISKLIKRKYQDPKIQKVNENLLSVLGKIYGTNNNKEINQALDNSIKILKNMPQYKALVNDFEMNLKNHLLFAKTSNPESLSFSRQAHVEKFYTHFKDEKNMMKKITMVKTVLTSSAYKYDKELNAASLKLLQGLENMGLELE